VKKKELVKNVCPSVNVYLILEENVKALCVHV